MQNHKVITFKSDDIVTFCILKKDQAVIDNHMIVVMVKSILHKRRHQIQTKFDISNWLYPTKKLNVIPSVNQDSYRKDFLGAPTKLITLHAIAAKIGTSNKIAVSCNCKKSCTPQSKCKCRKNKVECLQYCHNSRRDCRNAESFKANTDVTIVPKREEKSENKIISERESSKL